MLNLLIGLIGFFQTWTTHISSDGKFEVQAPGIFMEQIDTIETEVGNVAYHTLFFQADADAANQVYMLNYCDYPEGAMHSDSTALVEDFFKATMAEAKFSINGELMYQNTEQFMGYPACFWRIDYLNGKAVIKTKAILVKSRYYSIQVVAAKARHINPDSERFLSSFRLLE